MHERVPYYNPKITNTKFSRDLISRINPGNSLFYDITSLPSYGSAEILEYGHAKDHPELEQINLGMVMERSRNIPLFFEIYSGRCAAKSE